jgi:ABC-2 type transport system permease protein
MRMFFRKAAAFIMRDLRIASYYRTGFVLNIFGILFSILTFYFMSRMIGVSQSGPLSRYGGDYFGFVVVGMAFTSYLGIATRGYADTLIHAQYTGTLEAMLMTPTPVGQIVFFSSMYNFIFTSVRVIVYITVAALFFGMKVTLSGVGSSLLYLVLSVVAFSSLGILSAAFILVLKRGDPLAAAYGALSYLFGGVFYPITVLPEWLQYLAKLFPLTWALEGVRMALLSGKGISETWQNAAVLMAFSVVLWPVSIASFKYAVRRAKREGSLGKF